ncbi:magnesium transporter [Brevibacterium sp. 50QC2O2]|jgi:magnesium transporter|uniref:magnesium transporter n=1 Tax=unclassified Brevibacterium TaxID=2614124 RepID=UPI00211C8FDE|nr:MULTISPECIES: magnesium transporter [unclassified Brevibacterium]MCQ9369137.1 magnesium transporter [Brevibacterium sp. 91QC2O2]MCQ9389278.1 magnesium transporter [Brevibacterium sp. 50QC2O2]
MSDTLHELLRSGAPTRAHLPALARAAQALPVAELLYVMRSLPPARAAILYRVLEKDTALDVFDQLSAADQAELIGGLRTDEIAELIGNLDPDDRARLLDELPAKVADRLLAGLDPQERANTSVVLGYPKDSIGRHMSPEVLLLRADSTAGRALARVRERIAEPETVYLLPVVAANRRLVGVLGLRRLLAADPETPLRELMQEPVAASATDDREPVARLFLREKLIAMPIVDGEDRVVGILTVDDAIDIIAAEDAQDAARSGGSEPLAGSYLSTPILRLVRSRIVWLVVLAVSAILTVQVLDLFEDKLHQVVALALFVPLLTGTGGNTGNQAATTVTRALAVGEVRSRDLLRVVWREVRVGAILGLVLGCLGWLVAGLVYGFAIGAVIGLTLLGICTMAATVGGLMPLVAKAVGADPAVFSNPFISTFCDATGLLLYFGIATAVLGLS